MVDSNWWLSQRSKRIEGGDWNVKTDGRDGPNGAFSFVGDEFIAHPDDLAAAGPALAGLATEIVPDRPGEHDWLVNGLRLYTSSEADLARYVEDLRIAASAALGGARPRIGLHYVLTGEIKAIIPRGGPAVPPWPVLVSDPTPFTPVDWGDHQQPLVAVLDTGIDAGSIQAQPVDDPVVMYERGTPAHPEPDDVDVLNGPAPAGGAPTLASEAGHGTFITSLVERLAGGGVRMRSVRVLDPDGGGTEKSVVEGLQRLRRNHPEPTVQIVNLSLGGFTDDGGWDGADPAFPPTLKDQMPVALAAEMRLWAEKYPDTVFVCAAGNDGQARPFWPAAASQGLGQPGPSPVVVAVGSLDGQGQRSWFSNEGEWVTVWALGEDIVSEYPDGEFATTPDFVQRFPERLARWSGTSFAAPLVAAEIARLANGQQNPAAAHEAWLALKPHLGRRDPQNADFDLEYDPRVHGPGKDPRYE